MQSYPASIDDTVESIGDAVRFICRVRPDDIDEFNNLDSRFISGNAAPVRSVPGVVAISDYAKTSDLVTYAPLASPTFTGTPSLPTGTTGVTQTSTDSSIKLATTEFANSLDLGVGQTWQAVTRTAGVQYTNSTSKPIITQIRIVTSTNYVLGETTVSINGGSSITVAICGGGGVAQTVASGSIVIPPGATYTFTDSFVGSRTTWELR